MAANADKLLRDALTLPANERAELAAELLTTLEAIEPDVEAAWAAEIVRRGDDARRNPDDEDDWRAALAQIQRDALSR